MKKRLLLLGFMVLVLALLGGVVTASAADLIPTMTSNTTPSGTVSASHIYSSSYDSWEAFDDITNTYGWQAGCDSDCWLAYEFPSPTVINRYTICMTYGACYIAPKTWLFQAWDNNSSSWITLDSQADVSWLMEDTRVYSFNNTNPYLKYRIFITASNDTTWVGIDEMEMMTVAPTAPSSPTDLAANAGDSQVSLSWTEVTGADSYKVKRSATSGGSYESIAEVTYGATYIDLSVTNGTEYYYVVTTVVDSVESANSTEVSATPQATTSTGNGTLVITVANNEDREYNLAMAQIEAFISWYNNRSTGGNIYIIEKPASGAYTSIRDYLVFDKIVAWEVRKY